jgi:hypothetical protein
MTPLEAEIMRRNARFRAWRDYGARGVLVLGWWRLDAKNKDKFAALTLYCDGCPGLQTLGEITDGIEVVGPALSVLGAEVRAIGRAIGSGCTHVLPLLGPDPEEVVALTALALLEAP